MAQKITDNVVRMEQLLEKHAEWTWTKPERIGLDHVVEYVLNGEPQMAAHHDLGKLESYLEALDRSTMSGIT